MEPVRLFAEEEVAKHCAYLTTADFDQSRDTIVVEEAGLETEEAGQRAVNDHIWRKRVSQWVEKQTRQ